MYIFILIKNGWATFSPTHLVTLLAVNHCRRFAGHGAIKHTATAGKSTISSVIGVIQYTKARCCKKALPSFSV
jgi:hypothetical protein